MIERDRIIGYRKLRELEFTPRKGLNILVGDNDAGKSTLLEAITLGLTGRVNGRLAGDEINPFWFNAAMVQQFFSARSPRPDPETSRHPHRNIPARPRGVRPKSVRRPQL
ncbi:ATP-binding protein [Mycobacterium sp. M23085]|uniref:ATP-binding protein n=1 Tax=Mycobacterium sp. M23085 TaxID=3378087 RepID=UPI00387799C8